MEKNLTSKRERISDRMFTQSLVVSVIGILMCMIALCSTSYAWFTSETTSKSHTLTSGCFDFSVELAPAVGESVAGEIVAHGDGTFKLGAMGRYTVVLTPTDNTNVKGHCVITVNGGAVYKTNVIVTADTVNAIYNNANTPFVFEVYTEVDDVTLSILPCWGVPAEYEVEYDGVILVNSDHVLSY